MSLGQMNKREAEGLVEAVFTHPYDEANLRRLVLNIFPDMQPKSDRWTGAYIPEAFRGGVAQYSRLGKVEDAEGYTVDVLAVKLKSAGTLERARTLQRNFVARYLNGGRGGALRDAALVAFYADGSPDWRFSLVRMDYTLDEVKNRVRKELTPARRYSFLVGRNEKTHTARKQLATLLQGGARTTLGELEKAFNIESVTKEFFEKYKTLFLNLKEELDGLEQHDPRIQREFADKSIDTATFAKRLLGQVVFLYFLQKKGWLGVGRNADGSLEPWGTGPKDFLRRLFEKRVVPYENFFDDLLEPLFYEALANDRGAVSYYSPFECRIPFLNGGLFEPVGDYNWAETRINLKNETFAQIFSTFDLYNFTVREDEPLDKEVAVDPEMLGKVFENLLEVKDRKSKGAFYTPREIVHYMCQESLINYLDTALNTVTRPLLKPAPSQAELFGRPQTRQEPLSEEVYEERVPRADIAEFIRLGDTVQEHDAATAARVKETDAYSFKVPSSVRQHAAPLDGALSSIKICDPAIGSGAFPVGMMNEIVRARGALNAYLGNENRSAYDFKRHAIQESIYGVDIEESAVDIAKLRLWLSLVVDEDDYGTIKPLPNLEYKIVIGNSLLGVEETLFNNDLFEKLEKLKQRYFDETRQGEKGRLKGEIGALIKQLTRGEVDFDFKVYFSEVFQEKGGFDIVIGNPPYIRIQELQKSDPKQAKYFKDKYASAGKGNYDIYVVFIEKGLRLLNKRGYQSYILPHKFFNAKYGEPVRELISRGKHLSKIVHFGDEQIFEGASTYVCLLFLNRSGSEQFELNKVDDLPVWMRTYEAAQGEIASEAVNGDEWNFSVGSEATLFKKLSETKTKLEHVTNRIFQGIKTSADKIYIVEEVERKDGCIKIYSKEKDAEYWLESSLLHPLIKGGDSKAYRLSRTRRLILFPYARENQGKTSLISEEKLKRAYPLTWTYLLANKTYLENRENGRMKGLNWYAYGRNQALDVMPLPKLFTPDIALRASFSLDATGDIFFTGGVSGGYGILVSPNYSREYVLGLLNSKVLNWFNHQIATQMRGGYYSFESRFIRRLPIRTINPSDPTDKAMHDQMVTLVERMLSLHEEKGQNAGARPVAEIDAEIRRADAEIDALVYRLYGLTEEEIRIVEGTAA